MSRFDAYLLEAVSRGKVLSLEDAQILLAKNCKQSVAAYKADRRVFRGMHNSNNYMYVDPKKGTRRSVGDMPNYYTFILSNDKSWSAYPKRTKSLICTTNLIDTQSYGSSYVVFFYDGAKIGVVPDGDIWFAWKSEFFSIKGMVNGISMVFNEAYGPESGNSVSYKYDKTFKEFKDACKKVDEKAKGNVDFIEKINMRLRIGTAFEYKGNFYKMLVNIFSPKKFKLLRIKDISTSATNEVWSDSEAILIGAGQNVAEIIGV